MNMKLKRIVLASVCSCSGFLFAVSGIQAQDDPSSINYDPVVDAGADMVALQAELAAAKPFPTPTVEMPADGISSVELEKSGKTDPPGYSLGWVPGSGPMTDPTVRYTITPDHPLYEMATGEVSPGHGTAPTNPYSGPYSPYQRWTHFGRYTAYPTSAIGKLYFDTDANGTRDSFCSASVIGSRVIATAGHCIASGTGTWYSNFLFCPSYNSGGINPLVGCWAWSYATVSNGWWGSRQFDRDYGCIVTATTGTVHSTTVGARTGWYGRAWNWGSSQATIVQGYPANNSLPGYNIITGSSTEWYEVNMTSGDGQVSKYIGGDQHSGNSGGPWLLNWSHRNKEWAAVDNISGTDPGSPTSNGSSSPFINGVYSHKRCVSGCASPPTTSAGLFWNEMGAAEFDLSAGDTDESEDVFARCYAND